MPWRSRLLNFYADEVELPARIERPAPCVVQCPPTFSFIDAPDDTLATLHEFVRRARDGARTMEIDQRACEHLDLCAATVLNALALEARERMKTLFLGDYPAAPEAREIVTATGLPRLLRVRVPESGRFLSFGLRHGGVRRRALLFRSSAKEEVSSDLAKYLDRCLGVYGYGFTPGGMRRVGQLAGEVLGNAEDHAPQWPWYVSAYLRQPDGKQFGDCHIALFNFGPTLAETLQRSLAPGNELRTRIEQLVDLHRRAGFFGLGRRKWTEEGLWTLYALQDYVTRHYGEENSDRHGVGTMDMIEAFQLLGRTANGEYEPRMCVVSGHTQIVFGLQPHHRMVPVPQDGGVFRRIAFNQSNDLREPPDAGAVQHLQYSFPGTLISLRFYLDGDYLQKIHSDHAKSHQDS